jgi:HD-GYP domain-containing protein (c-di-GMP phosphodiesterase class II)/DNA-binding CsgD family transcriptional regulator
MTPPLRLAEFIGAVSLATDLGMGQPLEQGLRTCLVALDLADVAGLAPSERPVVYYTALLRFLGCTADAPEAAAIAGDDIALRAAIAPVLGGSPASILRDVLPALGHGLPAPKRAALQARFVATGPTRMRDGVRAHCEAGEMLALRLGLPEGTRPALAAAFEQWNGHGFPNGIRGESIPIAARVVTIARDVEVVARLQGIDTTRAALQQRAGRAYDPALAAAALTALDDLVRTARTELPWGAVMEREPAPALEVPAERLDDVLSVFADFTDLKDPARAGFSRDVAALAAAASPDDGRTVRVAGLVQDFGRVAVPSSPHSTRSGLGETDERVRLHPYYSERILARTAATAPIARLAGSHHERLDGSGYYRGAVARDLAWDARVLAAATAFRELLVTPPDAPAPTPSAAADALARLTPHALDPDAVDAVLEAAGVRTKRLRPDWPAGLTEREVEVLRLICRGATKKDVSAALFIAPSTADHHVRNIYSKIGVSSRAAATLYAVEHDLL